MRPLHPFTFWAIFTAISIGVVLSDSVAIAIAAMGGAGAIVRLRKSDGPWSRSFRWSLIAGGYLLAIRAVTGVLIGVPIPGRTLFNLPQLDLPSWLPGIRIGGAVTLERLAATLHEGVIIAAVIALFGAANSVTSPHKLLRVLPAKIYQISVTLTIATSVFPQMISAISRIRDAQYLRSGTRPRIPTIALPLLEESLTKAVSLAESMESRGYGQSQSQSRYRPIEYRPTDFWLMGIGLITAIVMVAL